MLLRLRSPLALPQASISESCLRHATRTSVSADRQHWIMLPQGIRINAVNPGNIATEGLNRVFEKLGVTADAVTAMVLMGRIAQAEEVAQVVVFLCSDAASYITGQSLAIDGRYTAN
nr:SDR family oxidoreductase [Nostoc sp. EkiNYC01]